MPAICVAGTGLLFPTEGIPAEGSLDTGNLSFQGATTYYNLGWSWGGGSALVSFVIVASMPLPGKALTIRG